MWLPLSLIRVIGHLNLVIILSYINLVSTSLVHDSTGCASSHFVMYSTFVMIYLAPSLYPGFGKAHIKYMA